MTLFPHTSTRLVELLPSAGADAGVVYDLRFRSGASGLPLKDEFTQSYARGKVALFLVRRVGDSELVGTGALTDLAPAAGHLRAEVDLVREVDDDSRAHVVVLLANFAFAMWRIHKLYFHSLGAGARGVGLHRRNAALVTEEAVLTDHVYHHGALCDLHITSIARAAWDSHGASVVDELTRG